MHALSDLVARLIIGVLIILSSSLVLAAPATENKDPLRRINQVTQAFNDKADKFLLRPIATGYSKVLPSPVKRGIGNFFSNLGDINNGVNNLLQGKPEQGLSDFMRLLINTSIGLGGLFDPATKMGLEKHHESFGQTLSVWGVPSGPYLVLPFLGPSTITDIIARPVDVTLDPLAYFYPIDHRNSLYGTRVIDFRESLLGIDKVAIGDRYIFFREAYLQRRAYLVNDGEIIDAFDDF